MSDTSFYSIKNNVANGISKHFISIEDSIYNLELANNMVRFNTSGNPVLVLSGTANAPVKNSAIIDNVVFAPSGNYTPFANVDIDESTLVRLFEDSKIAIGNVTAMDSIFNVKGGASFSGGIHVSGEFKSGMLQSGGILFAGSDGIIENDYANLYYNSASRRLGVQVNSPEAALHVAEGTEARLLFGDNGPNSNPQLTIFKNDDSIIGSNLLGYLAWAGKDNTGNTRTTHAQIYVKASSAHDPGDNPTDMYFDVTPDNSSTLTTRMLVQNDGDLGIGSIGSSTPEATLHVFSSSESEVLISDDGPASNTQLTFYRNDDNIVGDNPLGYLSWAGKDNTGNTRTVHARIYVKAASAHDPGDNPTNMYFDVTPDNSSTLTTALYIDHNGNIGIGTETPSDKLAVTGYVQRNEVDFYEAVHLFKFGTAAKDTVDSREEVLSFADGDTKIGKTGFSDWFTEIDSVQISVSTSSSANKNAAFDLQWVGIGTAESTGQSFSSAISDTISLGSTSSVRKVLTFMGEFSNLAANDAILWKLTRDGSISNNEPSAIRVHDIRFFYN